MDHSEEAAENQIEDEDGGEGKLIDPSDGDEAEQELDNGEEEQEIDLGGEEGELTHVPGARYPIRKRGSPDVPIDQRSIPEKPRKTNPKVGRKKAHANNKKAVIADIDALKEKLVLEKIGLPAEQASFWPQITEPLEYEWIGIREWTETLCIAAHKELDKYGLPKLKKYLEAMQKDQLYPISYKARNYKEEVYRWSLLNAKKELPGGDVEGDDGTDGEEQEQDAEEGGNKAHKGIEKQSEKDTDSTSSTGEAKPKVNKQDNSEEGGAMVYGNAEKLTEKVGPAASPASNATEKLDGIGGASDASDTEKQGGVADDNEKPVHRSLNTVTSSAGLEEQQGNSPSGDDGVVGGPQATSSSAPPSITSHSILKKRKHKPGKPPRPTSDHPAKRVQFNSKNHIRVFKPDADDEADNKEGSSAAADVAEKRRYRHKKPQPAEKDQEEQPEESPEEEEEEVRPTSKNEVDDSLRSGSRSRYSRKTK